MHARLLAPLRPLSALLQHCALVSAATLPIPWAHAPKGESLLELSSSSLARELFLRLPEPALLALLLLLLPPEPEAPLRVCTSSG